LSVSFLHAFATSEMKPYRLNERPRLLQGRRKLSITRSWNTSLLTCSHSSHKQNASGLFSARIILPRDARSDSSDWIRAQNSLYLGRKSWFEKSATWKL
jgi:hypothetical protein